MTGIKKYQSLPSGLLFLAVLALANALLLAPAGSLVRTTGALVLLLLPGIIWVQWLLPAIDRLARWTIGAGLSYALAMSLGLILHYLPGPIPFWSELVILDAFVLIPWIGTTRRKLVGKGGWAKPTRWLVVILLVAALFRLTSLDYSEFQGDEALAMISAAEALEGHQDALFLRGKGPGEVLLPMVLWRLTGTVNEPIARLPFTIAGLLMVPTIYLLGCRLLHNKEGTLNTRAGLVAAGLIALNGFMVGFSRIVQYQAFVVWMSGLALLCAWEWRATWDKRPIPPAAVAIWAGLTGTFLGTGLLAHYDAILVAPAIGYIGWTVLRSLVTRPNQSSGMANPQPNILGSLLVGVGSLLGVTGLFYVPYILDPQAARTGGYLGDRIGDALLKNNLGGFLHFNVFYNSSYYLILTGLLVLGFLGWALHSASGVQRLPGGRYWVPAVTVIAILGLTLRPNTLQFAGIDVTALPFALTLLGAFLSSGLHSGQRAVVAWLAVPFLGYNFAVALPLTHIYTIVPAWTLLAGLAAVQAWDKVTSLKPRLEFAYTLLLIVGLLLPAALFGGYLHAAYLRHDVELWQDWPGSLPALYWSPYDDLPPAGFFGFAHRTGWKEVGSLYAEGVLSGDYNSNEEPDVTTWYTRGAPRACDPGSEYYFIADDLIDPWPVDLVIVEASYNKIGKITQPNGKGLTIYQAHAANGAVGESADLEDIDVDNLTQAFDRTARPSAFARSARGNRPLNANLGNLVQLVGYDIDARRASPGGRVAVTLYWQAQAPILEDYHVFVHLEGDGETQVAPGLWGQADGRPVCWTYPTFDWRPGQIIADQHAVTIKPDTPPGDYPVLVGMYNPESGVRLDVLDEAGEPIANFMKLTTVSIR